jgi:4-hydroxybenzoate polyprenyltransferase
MGPLDLTLHVLNFVAPAAWLAALVVLATRFLMPKRAKVLAWWSQLAITFVAGVGVLAAGMLVFGRDGKMLTYAALVLAVATAQWVAVKGWQR